MLAAVAIGLVLARTGLAKIEGERRGAEAGSPIVCEIITTAVLIWLAPLVALYVLGRKFDFWMQVALFFTRSAFVTAGGSYTVTPTLRSLP